MLHTFKETCVVRLRYIEEKDIHRFQRLVSYRKWDRVGVRTLTIPVMLYFSLKISSSMERFSSCWFSVVDTCLIIPCDFCMFEIFHRCILLSEKGNEIFPNLGKKNGFCNYSMFLLPTCILFLPQICDLRSLLGTRQKGERERGLKALATDHVREWKVTQCRWPVHTLPGKWPLSIC